MREPTDILELVSGVTSQVSHLEREVESLLKGKKQIRTKLARLRRRIAAAQDATFLYLLELAKALGMSEFNSGKRTGGTDVRIDYDDGVASISIQQYPLRFYQVERMSIKAFLGSRRYMLPTLSWEMAVKIREHLEGFGNKVENAETILEQVEKIQEAVPSPDELVKAEGVFQQVRELCALRTKKS